MSGISRVQVGRPETLATVMAVNYASGNQTTYAISVYPIGRRSKLRHFILDGGVLLVSAGDHARFRQAAHAVQSGLNGTYGQRIARDWFAALAARDTRMLHLIANYLLGGTPATMPRTYQPGPPQPAKPQLNAWQNARTMLGLAGRTEDVELVEAVAQRFSSLSPREQSDAVHAVRAIVDAYRHIDRLTPRARIAPGHDGRTPQQDADAVIAAALARLDASLTHAQEADSQALRVLRHYSSQWEERENPLRLD